MKIRRVDPWSVAKVTSVLYAALGLIFGAFMSIFSVLGIAFGGQDAPEGGGAFALLFGAGAIVILPLLYGVFGAFMAAISAALYNVASRFTGGIEIEIDGGRPSVPSDHSAMTSGA